MFSFCFAVAIGVLWEIFEFTMDNLFGLNMQKSGLLDTMSDLIIDSIGAFLVSVSGFVYMKKWTVQIFSRLIRKFIEKNPRLFNSELKP